MIINRNNSIELFTGFKALFNEGFKGVQTDWAKIAEMVQSESDQEIYAGLGDWPEVREWIGERQLKKLEGFKYAIVNKQFESTIRIPVNAIKDDKYGVHAPKFRGAGRKIAEFPDKLVFQLLAAGFVELCYDGLPFFSAAHKVGKTTVSNLQAGASAPWFLLDANQALKPLVYQEREKFVFTAMTSVDDEVVFNLNEFRYGVAGRSNAGFGFWQQAFGSKATLDATNFNAAMLAIQGQKNPDGEPLGTNPSVLVVGPTNRAAALEIIKSERLANGQTNVNRDVVSLIVTPWLT